VKSPNEPPNTCCVLISTFIYACMLVAVKAGKISQIQTTNNKSIDPNTFIYCCISHGGRN